MKRKLFRNLFAAMCLLCFTVACTSDDDSVINKEYDEAFATLLHNMEMYGTRSTTASAKFNKGKWQRPNSWGDKDPNGPNMNDKDYNWKDSDDDDNLEDGWEDKYMGTTDNSLERAYFFIRLDGEAVTDHGMINSMYYYPQDADGSSHYGEMNRGVIETNLENTAINPAKWNYYNRGVTKYIYSSNGSATEDIIVEAPDITKWSINGEAIDTTKYHVIWYIVKLQSDGWHVDGILTTKDVTELPDNEKDEELEDTKVDPTPTPDEGGDDDNNDDEGDNNDKVTEGEVEFDIHQQEHQNWNEIKTTVHLRDTVNVRIFLPVDGQYIAVADDFDIRVGDTWGYVFEEEPVEEISEKIKVEYKVGAVNFETYIYVTHKVNGIEILIEGSTCAEALKLAREIYDDGITFEIHSYIYSSVAPETVWEWLKNVECAQTSFTGWPKSGDCCTYTYGQTTSAYYADEDIKYSERPE